MKNNRIGLQSLYFALKSLGMDNIFDSEKKIVQKIRQVNIAEGCLHLCSHCYTNPPSKIRQMEHSAFEILTKELSEVAFENSLDFEYLHLGERTDPSMIENYYLYFNTWAKNLPYWVKIPIYTHGWNLSLSCQRTEFENFMASLDEFKTQKLPHTNKTRVRIIISIDLFSWFARNYENKYIENLEYTVIKIREVLSKDALRFSLVCPFETLRYTEKLNNIDDFFYYSETNNALSTLSKALHRIGASGGYTYEEIKKMTYFNPIPKPEGRAFNRLKKEYSEIILLEQMSRYSEENLSKVSDKQSGIIILPDGRVNLVDLNNYHNQTMINNGKPVFDYLKSFKRVFEFNKFTTD